MLLLRIIAIVILIYRKKKNNISEIESSCSSKIRKQIILQNNKFGRYEFQP